MNWKKRGLLLLMACALCVSQALAAAQPGVTGKKFNRKFADKIRYSMPYTDVVKATGAQGRKVADDGRVQRYHWDGAQRSSMDLTVSQGKVTGGTLYSPKHRGFVLGKKGFEERD